MTEWRAATEGAFGGQAARGRATQRPASARRATRWRAAQGHATQVCGGTWRRRLAQLVLGGLVCWLSAGTARAEPAMSRTDVPEELQAWIPWALHGHESQVCPQHQEQPRCVWPGQ